jgi:LuxR family maltose regulon positive regulatory protein
MVAQESDHLIRTKLRLPFIRPGVVPRSRLQDQVIQGLRGPLVLITAPAGFGKTTLVGSCLAATGMPVAWLSLDQNDNQAGRFLTYLVAAVNGADDSVGTEAGQLLATSPAAPAESVLTSLINDLDGAARDLVLVLDDYHLIGSEAAHEAMSFLLEHQPQSLHLVLITRSDPPLPLTRLRAGAELVELRAADLRFTPDEAAAFLNEVMGLHLDAASVAALGERTEGWAAGLQMAALSMRDRQDVVGFIEGFSGTQRYILDYLLEEVLLVQPPEVQQFLLYTSILERLSAPLCDALLADGDHTQLSGQSDSHAMLDRIERANLFLVPLDDERVWYRYHHLFADLLRARLDQLYPKLSQQLHLRAAAWLAEAGMTVEAVNHTLSAGEYDRAARLVERNTTRLLAQGELNSLMAWIEILPAELRRTRPWLRVHQAYALLFAGRTADALRLLTETDAALGATVTDPSEARALKAAIAAARAFSSAVLFHDTEALSYAQQARQLLMPAALFSQSLVAWAEGYALHSQGHLAEARSAFEEQIRLSRATQNSATLMIGVTALARVLGDQGEFRQVRSLLEEALTDANAGGRHNRGYIARVETHLAAVLCEQNELDAARSLLLDALSNARFWLNPNHLASIYTFLTGVLLAQGDLEATRASIAELQRIKSTTPLSQWLLRSVDVTIVRIWIGLQGAGSGLSPVDPLADEAHLIVTAWQSEFAGRSDTRDGPMRQTEELPLLALARASLASDQVHEALRWLEPVTRSARAAGHVDTALHALVLTAVAFQRQGPACTDAAAAALEEALALAEPRGYARVFLTEGRPMRALLSQWQAAAAPGALQDYVARLLSQFPAEPDVVKPNPQEASPADGLIEPLTPRETQVLQLICAGHSNLAIADNLVITVATVKKHIGNILGKLGVTSRAQAMVKARKLGLLPRDD